MFVINNLKQILNNEMAVLFLIISYFLIFKTSKQLKLKNYHKDYSIVKATGIVYGLLAIAVLIIINI